MPHVALVATSGDQPDKDFQHFMTDTLLPA